ncbi:MAG: hypothetical protein SNJ59_11315 [Aggregatilineales bacterium]
MMQISRHWRMNAQRYRLEAVRQPNGEVRVQPRLAQPNDETPTEQEMAAVSVLRASVMAGR